MKKFVLLFVLFVYSFSFSQENYKYVIVPKKFSFFKEENKYNLNVVTKTFFEKEGFQVYFDTDEFSKELAENRCLALFVNAIEDNTIFSTKITIELKDCYNKNVYTGDLGTSKQKDFQKAYTEAFRNALRSMQGFLKIKKQPLVKSNEITKPEIIENKELVEELLTLPTETGYKLVDSKSEVVLVLYKTSSESIFTAIKGNRSGVLLKKNSGWFFEYYEGDKLFSEKVEVKF